MIQAANQEMQQPKSTSAKSTSQIVAVFPANRASNQPLSGLNKQSTHSIFIDGQSLSSEQAVFQLSTEYGNADVILLYDAVTESYDFKELAARIRFHYPEAKIGLVAENAENYSKGLFQTSKELDFVVRANHLPLIESIADDNKAFNNLAIINDVSNYREDSKVSEIVTRFTKTKREGEEFSDYKLVTPVAPKELDAEETVHAILARERVCGKILLITPSQFNVYGCTIKPAYPPLGLLSIAAILEKAGHQVSFIDIDADGVNLDDILNEIEREKYDAIGLTSVTSTFNNAVDIAGAVKKRFPHIHTIYGGIHATVDPIASAQKKEFDFVVAGEGECTAVELFDVLMAKNANYGKIKGLLYRDENGKVVATGPRHLIPEMDDFPPPAIHLLRNFSVYAPADAAFLPVVPVMVSRGCPGQCTYCQTKNIFGKRTRFRTPQHVLEEIRQHVYQRGVKEVHFLDDVITADRRFVKELCRLLKLEPYKLRLLVPNGLRADMVNEETLSEFVSAGLGNVGFGIETGSEKIAKLIKKGISKDQVRRAIRISKDLGLETWGFFIIGLPGDTAETIQETIDFAIELDPKFAKFLILKPFPGSEAYFQLDERGLIDSRDYSQYGVYTPAVHHLSTLSQEDILRWQKIAFRRFYFRPKKILQHVLGINSFGKFVSVLRGIYFILHTAFSGKAAGVGVNTGG